MIYHCYRAWGGGHNKNSQIPSWGDWHKSAPVIFYLASQCAQPQPIAQHITPHQPAPPWTPSSGSGPIYRDRSTPLPRAGKVRPLYITVEWWGMLATRKFPSKFSDVQLLACSLKRSKDQWPSLAKEKYRSSRHDIRRTQTIALETKNRSDRKHLHMTFLCHGRSISFFHPPPLRLLSRLRSFPSSPC